MVYSADSVHVRDSEGTWAVEVPFPCSQMKPCPLARGSGSQALYLLGTCIVCSGQSRGHGQAPVKGKTNVLAWYEESQGHG